MCNLSPHLRDDGKGLVNIAWKTRVMLQVYCYQMHSYPVILRDGYKYCQANTLAKNLWSADRNAVTESQYFGYICSLVAVEATHAQKQTMLDCGGSETSQECLMTPCMNQTYYVSSLKGMSNLR